MLFRSESMTFNEPWRMQIRLRGQDRSVEAFQMTHLENQFLAGGERDQLTRFLRGLGNRFLDEHVRTGAQEILCDLEVRGRLRNYTDGVDRAQQLAVISDGANPEFPTELVARLLSRVSDGHQLATRGLCVFLCVKSAEIADTDDCCSDLLFHKGIMPRLAIRPRIGR